MPRAAAATASALACLAAVATLLLPWWTFTSTVDGGASGTSYYGPFNRPATHDASFKGPVVVLGLLVLAALVTTGLATGFAGTGRSGWSSVLLVLGLLAFAGAAVYVWLVFPSTLDAHAGATKYAFWDRHCATANDLRICNRTAPGLGWWVGAGGSLLALVAMLLQASPARPPMPGPAAKPPAATSSPTRAPPPSFAGAARTPPGTTERMKCPRCQTWLAFSRPSGGPTRVECHNCLYRFTA